MAEAEETAAFPSTAARVAHDFARDAYVVGSLRVGGALRAAGAGDAGTEGVGAAASGERATGVAVEDAVWGRWGEEGEESHDYFRI